jgi:hypothetical protein
MEASEVGVERVIAKRIENSENVGTIFKAMVYESAEAREGLRGKFSKLRSEQV